MIFVVCSISAIYIIKFMCEINILAFLFAIVNSTVFVIVVVDLKIKTKKTFKNLNNSNNKNLTHF